MIAVEPGSAPATVSVTLGESGLNVGMQVYDDSGVSPVPVGGVTAMLNYDGTSYRGKVGGTEGKWYLVKFKVYTAPDFLTVDTDEPQGDEILYFKSSGSGGGSTNVGELTADISALEVKANLPNNDLSVSVGPNDIKAALECEEG